MQLLKDLLKRGLDPTSTGIPTEMEVNEILARNRDELMLFEEMDGKHVRMKHRERLMTEEELPEWVTQSTQQEKIPEEVFNYDCISEVG